LLCFQKTGGIYIQMANLEINRNNAVVIRKCKASKNPLANSFSSQL
jgi:hypothetical protein